MSHALLVLCNRCTIWYIRSGTIPPICSIHRYIDSSKMHFTTSSSPFRTISQLATCTSVLLCWRRPSIKWSFQMSLWAGSVLRNNTWTSSTTWQASSSTTAPNQSSPSVALIFLQWLMAHHRIFVIQYLHIKHIHNRDAITRTGFQTMVIPSPTALRSYLPHITRLTIKIYQPATVE